MDWQILFAVLIYNSELVCAQFLVATKCRILNSCCDLLFCCFERLLPKIANSCWDGMGVDGMCPKIFFDLSQNRCLAFCTLLHLLPPSQPARTAAVHLLGLPKYRLGQSTLQIAVAWSSKFLFVSSELKKSQETQSAIMIRSLLRVFALAVALGNAEGGEVCDEALTEVVACQGRYVSLNIMLNRLNVWKTLVPNICKDLTVLQSGWGLWGRIGGTNCWAWD